MSGAEGAPGAPRRWLEVTGSAELRAAVDRVIPADEWPGGWQGGVGEYLAERGTELQWALSAVERLVDELRRRGFAVAEPDEQDRVLEKISEQQTLGADFAALRRLCWEGFYASRHSAADRGHDQSWPSGLSMIGFREVPDGVTPVDPDLPASTAPSRLRAHYDAIVIGSGPGGGVAAQALARAGHSVLVVERARPLSNSNLRGDHLHGKRNAVYDSVAGPGRDHPRIAVQDVGHGRVNERVVDGDGDAWAYGLNAYAFGGGTRLWQGMAWRFFPEDFEMARLYGNPEGATLADWPIDYDELEPYYTLAEWELGVAGEEGALTARTPRSKGYPMPAMGTEPARELLAGAAERLGWTWGAIPLAINSVPAAGRAACVRCSSCVGHACPVDAKNGAHNTFLPRALATGNAEIVFDAEAIVVRDGPRRCLGRCDDRLLRRTHVAHGACRRRRRRRRSGRVGAAAARQRTRQRSTRSASSRSSFRQHPLRGRRTDEERFGPGSFDCDPGPCSRRLDPLGRRRDRRSDECAPVDLSDRSHQRRSSLGRRSQAMDASPEAVRLRRVRDGAGDPGARPLVSPSPGFSTDGASPEPACARAPIRHRSRSRRAWPTTELAGCAPPAPTTSAVSSAAQPPQRPASTRAAPHA